jgi:hypothetical protein
VGIHEMKSYLVGRDMEEWRPLIEWLEPGAGVVDRPEAACGASGSRPTDGV